MSFKDTNSICLGYTPSSSVSRDKFQVLHLVKEIIQGWTQCSFNRARFINEEASEKAKVHPQWKLGAGSLTKQSKAQST